MAAVILRALQDAHTTVFLHDRYPEGGVAGDQYKVFAQDVGTILSASRIPVEVQLAAYAMALAQALKANSNDAGTVVNIAIAAGQADEFDSIMSQASLAQ